MDITTLPFDSERMEPVLLWGTLSDSTGALKFHTLCAFIGSLLCLPQANVDVERVFSSVNLLKIKMRNRLHTKMVGASLKVKRRVA